MPRAFSTHRLSKVDVQRCFTQANSVSTHRLCKVDALAQQRGVHPRAAGAAAVHAAAGGEPEPLQRKNGERGGVASGGRTPLQRKPEQLKQRNRCRGQRSSQRFEENAHRTASRKMRGATLRGKPWPQVRSARAADMGGVSSGRGTLAEMLSRLSSFVLWKPHVTGSLMGNCS